MSDNKSLGNSGLSHFWNKIKQYVDSNSGSIIRGNTEVITDGTSTIALPFTVSNLDGLLVYHNGLLLNPTINYTADTSGITLIGYTANSGDIFTFVKYPSSSTQ